MQRLTHKNPFEVMAPAPVRRSEPPLKRVQRIHLGTFPDGRESALYVLTNINGLVCKVATYGGIITELHTPDGDGKFADIVLGYDQLSHYLTGNFYFGAIIGRVANRIANGRFTLDGRTYVLSTNDGPNHLHGGVGGFDQAIWAPEVATQGDQASLRLSYTSPDGEEGYPGTLKATVTYTLTDDDELRLDYEATTDQPTPVNLTHHNYWNLAGQGDILGHLLTLAADYYTPNDSAFLPTGEIKSVAGTAMDFRSATVIGSRLGQLAGHPPGYNDNYVLRHSGPEPAFAARVHEPRSGRLLEIRSDQPGVQFYTGSYLNGGPPGKRGIFYKPYAGFCLELQQFPDAVNHPNFPSCILRPGRVYRQSMVCRFSTL